MGLIVDAANDVLDIDESAVELPPEVVETVESDYIQGVVKVNQRLLILLHLEKVLSQEDIQELNKVTN